MGSYENEIRDYGLNFRPPFKFESLRFKQLVSHFVSFYHWLLSSTRDGLGDLDYSFTGRFVLVNETFSKITCS